MPYLNLDVNYFSHIKTVRLVGLLGRGAAELPLRLWAHCGANMAKAGSLTGYSAQEIEALVGWWGRSGECADAMVKVGFLEKMEDGYQVHDWHDHEGHLISYHLRAKEAAKTRWNSPKHATSMPQAMLNDKPSNAPAVQCSAISAIPNNTVTPDRGRLGRFVKPTAAEVKAYAASIGFRLDGEEFCAHYESKGWLIGKTPMKDWRSAVVTWKKKAQPAALTIPVKAHPPDPNPEDLPTHEDIQRAKEATGLAARVASGKGRWYVKHS